MKISMDNIWNIYRQNTAAQSVKREEAVPEVRKEKNFDELRISSEGEAALEETEFTKVLTAKLSAQVRQEPSAGKLDSLKERIQAGCYEIDASAIAAKILLEGKGRD